MRPDIAFAGAGNVAFRFSLALQEKGYDISFVYSRTERSRDKLVRALRANGSDTHATDISILKPLEDIGCRCGVVYPLMTLNRNKNVEFKDVPLLLESTSQELRPVLDSIASDLGGEHYFYSSADRLKMHVAAVFTTNFVNYLLGLAFPIVQHDHPLLIPSTIEAVRNAFLHTPASTLTGPARRGDMETIRKHLEVLESMGLKEQEEIYRLFTDRILEKYHHK